MLNISARDLIAKSIKLFDIAILMLFFWLTFFIEYNDIISFSSFLSIKLKIKHFLLLGILILLWYSILSTSGLYQSKRIGSNYSEYIDILKCNSLTSLSVFAIGFVFRAEVLSASFVLTFWLITNLFMMAERTVLRKILAVSRKMGKNQRNMIIVGTGKRAQEFAEMVQRRKELGYKLVGFVDDKWIVKKTKKPSWTLLGNLDALPEIINNNVVDEVTISLPVKTYYDKMKEIIAYCEEQGIIIRLLADIFTVSLAKSRLSRIDEIEVLTLHSAPYEDPRMIVKRVFDFTFSLTLLVLLSPLLLTMVFLIKLTTKGPVFFLQERVGYNKRIFKVIKFRTMVENAEKLLPSLEHLNEADGAAFKIKEDPRMTKLGKYLRKTSIDELPQLINVLKGDMSLVGPRPIQLRDYLELDANWQKRRFSMMPGITCFWQINGRNNVNFSKWMELDMEYIDKWSLWLDLKILLKTIPIIITGRGAM